MSGQEPLYPCDGCGVMRTKAEGGTTFTVCDACWDKQKAEAEIVKLRRINEQLKDDILFKQIDYDAFYRMKELSEQRGREVAELQGQLVEAQFARCIAEDEASHLRAKAQRMVDASAQYVKAVENLLTSAGIKLPWLGENGVA